MKMITRVTIENFKRFETIVLDIKSFDCLVGGNNSGKSTLLQALAFFNFVVRNCLSRKNGADSPIEIKNRSIAPEDFVVLPVASATDLWTNKKAQKNGKHILIRITVEFEHAPSATATVDLNFNRFSVSLETEKNQAWLSELIQFKISYLPVFSTFLTREERKTPAVIADALARGQVDSIIRNLLFDLSTQGKIKMLEEILSRAFPELQELRVQFDFDSDRFIDVSCFEYGKKTPLDLFMLGSGFQQFVYLFGFILLQNPDMILLDEPDKCLHGTLQGVLFAELNCFVQNEGKQVLCATHSRDFISKFEPTNVISLNEGKAKRLSVNFDLYDTLNSLGSFDNIQLSQLQHYRKLLVVEDESDRDLLRIFGKKTLGEKVWQQIERQLAIWYAKGNPYKQANFSTLKSQLSQMLQLTGAPLQLFVVCDRDYYPNREQLLNEINGVDPNVQYYIWEKNEIENYLLVTKALCRLISNSNTPLLNEAGKEMEQKVNQLIDESREQVEEQCISAQGYYWNTTKKSGYDSGTLLKKTREYMKENWHKDPIAMTDAKKIVLPGIKRWVQERGLSAFSDKKLAESLLPDELAPEVALLMERICGFAGVSR